MSYAKYVLSILFFITIVSVYGGDDPCNATVLDTDASGEITFDNIGNSDSGIDSPPYGDYVGPDTWLSFTMNYSSELPMFLRLGTMTNPAIAIYSGDCSDPKLIYNVIDHNCIDENNANDNFPAILFDELIPGEEYLIRIWAQSGTSNGSFSISFDTSVEDGKFLLYADAVDMSDGCIQLTDEVQWKHGCAWYENEIDFSMPFTHTMSAYFGSIDAIGADGICLVYQINGSDYCGGSGGGIGAEGMPNSVVVEFDTWYNGVYSDLVDDHCSVNINGNMNHVSSVNGPVSLGNIEDGVFHEIEFVWDPTTNDYIVRFDGIDVLLGNYDFVNNVFGGVTDVWWGYTASTGGSFNDQIICPIIPDAMMLGTQEYIEDTICEGEDYLGYTESGFYIEYVAGVVDCSHQLNILLEVIPEIEPTIINDTICINSYYEFEEEVFDVGGIFYFLLTSKNGCDSLVILELETYDFDFDIVIMDSLSCKNEFITLSTDIDSIDDVRCNYIWSGPEGVSNNKTWDINLPGEYELIINYEFNDVICSFRKNIVVGIDDAYPKSPTLNNVYIECDKEIENVVFSIEDTVGRNKYLWYFNGSIISDTSMIIVDLAGKYFVEVYDSVSGCSVLDSVSIIEVGERPSVSVQNDTITCAVLSTQPIILTSDDVIEYVWYLNNDSISNISLPVLNESGYYKVKVKNNKGCENQAEFEVFKNNKNPVIDYKDDTIQCDIGSVDIKNLENELDYIFNWTLPSGQFHDSMNVIAIIGGKYFLEVQDLTNGCITYDTVEVYDFGDSPIAVFSPKNLDCNNIGYYINPQVDSIDAIFTWDYNDQFFSDETNPSIENPGEYKVTISSEKGCENRYSFDVNKDSDTIAIIFEVPKKLTCDNKSVELGSNISNSIGHFWVGPNGYTSNKINPEVKEAGMYILEIINPINGCLSISSIMVEVEGDLPIFSLLGDTLDCTNSQVNLSLVSNDNYETIEWYGPSNYRVSNNIDIDVFNEGMYKVKVVNEYGCERWDSVLIVDKSLSPKLKLLSVDTIFYQLGKNYEIKTVVTIDEENIVKVQWNPIKSLSCGDCLNPIFLSDVEENLKYTLTVVNEQGCTDELVLYTRFVEEEKEEEPKVKISAPNIIIGDQSGSKNSFFTIYGTPEELIVEINSVKIYNRWGELVFEDYKLPINDHTKGWDSSFKGQLSMAGVYVYYAEVLLTSGEFIRIYGDVTVIR